MQAALNRDATYPALFARADTAEAMTHVPVAEIREIIKPCGLSPAKSKNIRALSEILVEQYDGEVPNTLEQLEALPGVGHKTASVVMCQWFNVPAFPVDTHIHRLAARWGLSNGHSVDKTEKDLKKVFPKESWIDLHLAIILFGREYCPARSHDPRECRICSWTMTKTRMKEEIANLPKSKRTK